MNYWQILYIGGDIKTLRNLECDADAKLRNLVELCGNPDADAERVVAAAEEYAVAAHDCDGQREHIAAAIARLDAPEEAKRAAAQLAKGPHEGVKAREIYRTLANLMARTETEDLELWDNPVGDAISWLSDGFDIIYKTPEAAALARSAAADFRRRLTFDFVI